MTEILGSVIWLLVALGLLVTFHEFGHYWVARRCGVRVLRFSVGFGKPLFLHRGRNGTEFVIAAIPLGGYVRMLDEGESAVDPEDLPQAFNRKSLGQRMAIVAAGPVFNLIFALAAFWLMFQLGIPETRPVIGQATGIAAEAGLERGDLITRVEDRNVETWTHALLALIPRALDRQPALLEVRDESDQSRELTLALDRLDESFREESALEHIGIQPWRMDLPPEIGEVVADGPAATAGLQAGDRIVAIAGHAVDGWRDIARAIPERARTGEPLALEARRDGRTLEFEVIPESGNGRPVIGVQPVEPGAEQRAAAERAFTILRHGPIEGIPAAFGETWQLTAGTLGILGRMITGQASLSNLSGPITIAQLANTSASLGLSRFLFFLGLISLSLAIINLLPIPMLDGGHLLYYVIEGIKGSPVSQQAQVAGQYIGLVMIFGLMSLALFNDILRLIP